MDSAIAQKSKSKQSLSPDQAAAYLRRLADQLESGRLELHSRDLTVQGEVKLKENYKPGPDKSSLKLELKLKLPGVPEAEPEAEPEESLEAAASGSPEPGNHEAESPAAPAEPEAEPVPEPQDYAGREQPNSYKKLKKRMAKDMKLIKKSLEAGQLPGLDLSRAFCADCRHMTSFKGKGDPYYDQFNRATQDLEDAVQNANLTDAARVLAEMDQMKKDCHKEYK